MHPNVYFSGREAELRRQQILQEAAQRRLARLAAEGQRRQRPALAARLGAAVARLRGRPAEHPVPRPASAPKLQAG